MTEPDRSMKQTACLLQSFLTCGMVGLSDARLRFMQAVWDMHSRVFQNYFDWCKHINLPYRPISQSANFAKSEPHSDEVVMMLVKELALYFCIWTEAANLRYMPESLVFVFWTMRFSPIFAELDDGREGVTPVPTDPEVVCEPCGLQQWAR